MPGVVGVPLIRPSDDKESPGGTELFSVENFTYGVQPVPGRPLSWYEYAFPVSPCGQILRMPPVCTGQTSSGNVSALALGTATIATPAARATSSRMRRIELPFVLPTFRPGSNGRHRSRQNHQACA